MSDLQTLLDSLEVKLLSTFVRFEDGPDYNWEHFAWNVTITRNGQSYTTTFRMGTASVNPMPRAFMLRDHDRVRAKAWLRHPKAPRAPDAATVVACLMRDARSGLEPFDDYCADFGLDSDSRKVLAVYLECQRTAKAMRALFGEQYPAVEAAASEY
jgi:hypothetical protein